MIPIDEGKATEIARREIEGAFRNRGIDVFIEKLKREHDLTTGRHNQLSGVESQESIGEVYPQSWGAYPGALARINTAAFNEAFKHNCVFIPEGEYDLNALDVINHPISIYGVDWKTVLNFNTLSDSMKFTITTPAYPLDEGVIMENIRFKSNTNIPASFINIDAARNAKLTRMIFADTGATVGILNQSCYGLSLHKCRWNHFVGTGLKLLDNAISPNFSYAVNLFDCNLSNITGPAIDQQGGDLKIFGGVIEYADAAGFIKLATNYYSSAVLFSGVYFEGTNSCFVLAPATSTYWPMTVLVAGGNCSGAGNWFDIGARGRWTFQNVSAYGGGNVTIKGTGNTGEFSPRVIMLQCVQENFTIDSGISNTVGKGDLIILGSMTTAQRDAITPANGMIIYNITTAAFNFYENGAWVTK